MQRDLLLNDPRVANRILIAGAIVPFLLCWPLYGRRGFPEVDPFWLAMIWLWVPAIPLSAVYEKWSSKRALKLLYYALATGFTVSWGSVEMVPSNKTLVGAAIGLIIYGPMMAIAVGLAEAVSRLALTGLRQFSSHPCCTKCGYWLRGLTLPRCPECGTEFPVELLGSSYDPTVTPVLRRWSALLSILVLLMTVTFPSAYRAHSFHSCAAHGAKQAEQDWQAGSVTCFVTHEEIDAMTPEQIDVFYDPRLQSQSTPRFQIWTMWPDWQHYTWQTAYRAVIERKLRETGRAPFTLPAHPASSPTTATATSG